MSILTFSDAMMKKFSTTIFPTLQDYYVTKSRYFRIKTSDKYDTDVAKWMTDGANAAKDVIVQILTTNKLAEQGMPADESIWKILLWVNSNVKYESDSTKYKVAEYWQTPLETLQLRTGDCEDGATLICAMAYVAGIDPSQYWLQWGEVIGGGHCYVCYLRETDGEEVVLDWCYWFTRWVVAIREWLGDDDRYGTIWGQARFNKTR